MLATHKLIAEVKGLAADTEELIEQLADRSEAGVAEARDRARDAASRVRGTVEALARAGGARARALGERGSAYVHENPWRTLAAIAVLGVIAGVLLSRR